MPIYEFKCSKCEEFFEVLKMSEDDEVKCPKCSSCEFERVLSVTNYAVGDKSTYQGVSAKTRNCSSGSCTTYTVPGVAGGS